MRIRLADARGRPAHEISMSVSGNKAGMQFVSLTLDAMDVQKLADLPPKRLHEWLRYWQCGFAPVRAQDERP